MNALDAISYSTSGLLSQGSGVPRTSQAGSGEQAPEARAGAAALTVAAAAPKEVKPGTVEDVAEANVAAKGSADLLGTPSPEYASAMSQVVRAASASARQIGARLDVSM
jgi:hypothetical protein